MADNAFSKDPVEALVQGVSKRPGANSRAAIEGIATKSQVPANFLMAFTELSPAQSDDDKARVAQAIADKIAPRLTSGEKIEDVVRSLAGEDKASADQFIERAYQIADELYQDRKAPAKEEPGFFGDLGRSLGGSLVRGAGGMIEAAGVAAEQIATRGLNTEEPTTVREAARNAGDVVRQYGEGIQAGMSEEAKRAIAESTPDGNIFDPSTWSAGKNPSLKGYALLAADVLGSFLPVVATAVLTRNPAAAATVGGLQGGGAGLETARDILTRASETVGPDGRSVLERESAYYRDMLAAGISREDALARTIAAGERMAFLMTAPVSAFGGAATSKILVPGEKALIGSGPLTRALGTAALSSLEEGTQEVAETLATRYGVQRATGMDLDLAQGTFGDFILGALGGGVVGGAAGGLQGGGRDDEDAPLALPAPDGSAPGGPLLALPAPSAPSAPEAPQATPRRTSPIKNVLKSAPPRIVPDAPAGGTVTVRAGDLPPFVGKIVRDDGVMVTIQDENGETLDVAMSQIESGEATIEVAEAPSATGAPLSQQALSKVAPPSPKVKVKPTPDEAAALLQKLEKQAETTGWTKRATARKRELEDIIASASPFDAAADALNEQGFYDGPWNEPRPETPAAEVAAATAGEAPLGGERTPTTTGAPSGADIARFIGSFERVAEDSRENTTVHVTDKGPWDFSETWPAPDAEKVAAREAEGRVEFELDDGPEAVVGILTETLNEMTAEAGFARQWEGELARIEAGEKPRFKVGKGEDPATVARRNAEEARRNASNIEGALRDVWSDEAVDAMVAEANAVLDSEKRAPEAVPGQREGAAKAAAIPPREAEAAGRPTGKTYRLDNALTEAERRVVGKFRDTDGGRLIGEIDAAVRRAEAQMRESGRDIDAYDANGRDTAGNFDQMAVLIREGERIARALIAEMRKKKGEAAFPAIDEDTGEPESDGSPAGNALDWLLTLEANGVAIDASDFADGDAEKGGADFSRKPAAEIFPPVRQTINLDALARRDGEISMAEADARIAAWKATAAEIGRTGANRNKVIVSLFDYTGAWSQPWDDAGYRVLRFDIKTGSDLLTSDWFWNRLTEIREQGVEVYGVLSACPCTTFAGSGARWWADLHDKESPEALAKVFGEGALSSGAKSALEYNLMLVKATRDVIEIANPTGFHVLENPIGRIQDAAGMPNPVARFHPYNFGNPYTKYTQLFGDFRAAMPFANVDPVEGSKMQSKLRGTDPLGKEARSTTPEGFSYAFFMANDPQARKMKDRSAAPAEKTKPTAERPTSEIKPATNEAVQPDLLGGREKTETEMAAQERRRREWGQYLAIAEGGTSVWEGDLEAATVKVNRRTVTIKGPNGSRVTDTDGMSRSDLVGWSRWAMGQVGGFAQAAKRPEPERRKSFEGNFSDAAKANGAPTSAEVKAAAREADRHPTDAQKDAGNYKMGHIIWNGLDITIETAKGAMRRGKGSDGQEWSVKMPAHYGYIKRTTGADGDHVDVYMGDNPETDRVYIIDQFNLGNGRFDEHKVILGAASLEDALRIYDAGFSDGKGPDRRKNRSGQSHSVEGFKKWLATADMTRPATVAGFEGARALIEESDARTGPVMDGYTRRMEGDEPTTTQDRVTEDGFVIERASNRTQITDPKGKVIFVGAAGVDEAKVNAVIEEARKPESAASREKPRGPIDVAKARVMRLRREKPDSPELKAAEAELRKARQRAFEDEPVPVGPRVIINKLTTADLLKDEGFKEGADGRLFLKLRNEETKTTRTYIVRKIKDGPNGAERTALQRLTQHDQHGGLPSKWLLDDAKGPDPILEAIEKDSDQGKGWVPVKDESESGGALLPESVDLPPDFFQTYAKPMTKAEADGTDHKPGTIKAIITRQSPFSAIDGYGATVNDALADASRKARAEIAKEETRKTAPARTVEQEATEAPAWWADLTASGRAAIIQTAKKAGRIGRSRSDRTEWRHFNKDEQDALFTAATQTGDNGVDASMAAKKPRGLEDAQPTDQRLTGEVKDYRVGNLVEAAPEAAENAQNGQNGRKAALGALTQAEQDRAALLRARIAERMRTQFNVGLDPELLKDAVELVSLYVKAGLRRFRAMLDQVAEDMELTARDIEPWARAAYNQARDDMELEGQDVSDMDDSKTVLAEVKALRAAASQIPEKAPILGKEGGTEAANGVRVDAGGDREGTEDGTGAATQGTKGLRDRGEGEPETGARDDGAERSTGRAERRKVDAGDDLFGGSLRDNGGRARNFVIEPGGLNPKAGEKTRARESVAAIRTLKEMGSRSRPTIEEQKVLSRYGGAGTLAGALPRSDGTIKFPDIAEDLDALLTEDEKRTLSRTSQYAFYTAEPALRAMWSLAQRLGFKGGRVFEPGMGVGGFIGTIPAQIRHATEYRGIELDHVTAAIAKRLYPDSQIDNGDFIKTALPSDYYDLAIGNPPFAGIKVQADPDYPQGFFLHDYFFAKTLDAVRPGGILMFVTSAGTMNKQDTAARDYLADRADLLGAIRLPNTAFKENGTEVTTDIIVLRKRLDGEKEADPSWRRAEVIDVPDPDGGTGKAAVNRYFIDHPEMILGEQGLYDTLTAANRIGVRPKPGSDLATDLAEAIARFTPGVMSEAPASIRMDARDTATAERKAGSYYIKDGDLYQFDGAAGVKVERRTRATPSGMSKGDYETIVDLLPIRDALRDVYAADVDGKDATEARARLNAAYDAFVKKRGPINLQVRSERRPSIVEQEAARQRALEDARAAGLDFDEGSFDPSALFEAGATLSDIARARNEARKEPGYREGDFNPEEMPNKVVVSYPNIDPFADDPESFRLRAIEKYDPERDTAQKSRVFTENAVTISVKPKISSPEDALLYVLSEDGRVDLNKIADLSGSTPDIVRQELGEKIFEDPASGEWQTAAKYLSGNVRKKLDEARAAARTKPELQINVQALESVQPVPIPAADIRVPIGAHWFPSEVYSQFAKSLGLRLDATFRPALGIWTVDGSKSEQAARNDWGTEDIPFADLMQRVMNNKPLKVTRTTKNADGSTNTFTDEAATQAANDKANELRNRFSQWFWEDRDRAEEMEVLYNSIFNAEVAPKYDGGYLTTPGIHADWSWRPHQTAAIARFLQSGNTYLAHTVGAGKTSEMIGIAMEGRRLGIVRKPMIVVPNHMLVQFATEFYQQYPLANILVADERRFHTSRRKQFIADVALGDWDAIVITHSAFGLIPVSDAAKGAAVSDMLRDIRDVLEDATASGDRGSDMATDRAILGALESVAATLGVDTSDLKEKGVSTRKKIERLLEAAEQRIARQTSNRGKDQVFDFDELGVDTLMVDEAHLFRKLSFATTNGAIKGIDPAGSQASMDLYIKTRALEAANPGRSLVFASGTPITNTMAELYTVSRYLQPQALAERGMSAFDAWAASFGQVDTALEQTPDGGYKEVSRFAKFVNTPELSLMVRQVMDVVSGPDLEKYVTRPKLKGGKRTHVVVEPSQEVLAYRDRLAARMKAIESRTGPVQKGDDILLSVINDGRLSAIDMRLVDPSATGHGSKLERMIQNVYRTWKEGARAPLHGVKKEGGYTDEPIMHGPSTQIVFATLGINPSKHNPDFSVHRFIKAELVRMGVPASDIILQEDLKTHALKQRAFGDMNEGRRRILVGSKTLFTGVNAQRRIAAIHNLDPLWFPADDEQRNGRGIRQGNMNPEIEIFDYSTKGTYDATMWQMMARKASFIEAFFRGDPNMREMEDLGEASAYEQAKALSTKDPRVLVLTELKAERDKLQRRSDAIRRQMSQLTSEIRYQTSRTKSLEEDRAAWAKVASKVVDLSGDRFIITIDGNDYKKRTEAGNALFSIAEAAVGEGTRVENRKVGRISGFPIVLNTFKADSSANFQIEAFTDVRVDAGWSADPVGLMRRLEGAVESIAEKVPMIDNAIRRAEKLRSDAEGALSRVKPFSEQAELESLRQKIADLESEMLAETKATEEKANDETGVDDPDKEMADLRGRDAVEAEPEITDDALSAISEAANRELAAHGLSGVVTVEAVRSLVSAATGAPVQGLWQPRMKAIKIRADAAVGAIGTLHHEIIHVLRSASVWGRQGGLITDREWRALLAEVARQPGLAERVSAMYPKLGPEALAEEQVAELYRTWRMKEDAVAAAARRGILAKIRAILEAVANGLRGQGFFTAASVMRKIASGEVARRGQGRGADGRFIDEAERFMASLPDYGFARTGRDIEANERGIIGHLLTNAMSGKNGVNLLALVPGRALFNELGRHIPSAQAYLRNKDAMDALRNKWQEKTDDIAQAWRKLIAQDGKANATLMDLMHDATISGVDPSRPFVPRADNLMKRAREEYSRFGEDAEAWALGMVRAEERKKAAHAELRHRYNGLPEAFRAMFVRVRNAYGELGDAFEQTVLDNAQKAMNLGLKRAEQRYQDDLRAIDDDGLEGAEREEAQEKARERLENAKKRAGWNSQARLAALRAKFESNRLDGPYFPLARFGNFFVTLRDADGKVISFSRFETEGDQAREAKRLAAEHPDGTIQTGVLSDANSLRNQVDPNFVADVEELIAEEVGDPKIMDMIWQRWLETLPDLSVRRSRLHRKGTPGYSGDAFRAFGRQMFHGSHQLARLKYAMDMQQNLMDARREAANAPDPNRAGLVVTEMERRHAFTMNPVGSSWAQYAGTAAFIYYLAVTPAAAMVNLTQTTIIGVPVLAAAFKDGGIPKAATEITKASRDFIGGRGHAQASANLTDDEKAAMREAYDRGVVDKTQAHDLAGVAETGVEYNAAWQKWMARIAWLFHHAERMNREVTFLAAYRMGRATGLDHEAAISKAADVTWKSHFDYQNTSRPRLMQNDYMKVLLTYRNYVINMNYRLFRDLHQMLKGETAEDRREARAQLGGITLSMMLHAGIKGTWGYALITSLLGMFADDGDDDVEEALQGALVRMFGTEIAGMMLNGVPGHLAGINLTKRIGMPELWFRSSDRVLEGEDAYAYWLSEIVGPVPGIAENAFRGAAKISDGDYFKGVEAMMPKMIRDLMKAYRYTTEGATTSSGLPLVENVGVVDAMKQALGFTPARIAEAYEVNSRLKNLENRIETERSRIINAAMREVMAGDLSDATLAKVKSFNEANPDYPITGDAIRRAATGRARAERDTVGGIRLNRRLDARLREEAAPLIYQ